MFCVRSRSDLFIPQSTLIFFFNPAGYIIGIGASSYDQQFSSGVVLFPYSPASLSQEIFIIKTQLFQAGSCHAGELEFCFF